MHKQIEEQLKALDIIWGAELGTVIKEARAKITEKAPDYEQHTPVWMSLNEPHDFQTMLKLKSRRVVSELERLESFEETWDPDNAIDLIVYLSFLVAYSRFAKKGVSHDEDMPNFPNEPVG